MVDVNTVRMQSGWDDGMTSFPSNMPPDFILTSLTFDPEDGSSIFLQNVGIHLHGDNLK
jgi:hypothetical protein